MLQSPKRKDSRPRDDNDAALLLFLLHLSQPGTLARRGDEAVPESTRVSALARFLFAFLYWKAQHILFSGPLFVLYRLCARLPQAAARVRAQFGLALVHYPVVWG